jgi:hypothetical protein
MSIIAKSKKAIKLAETLEKRKAFIIVDSDYEALEVDAPESYISSRLVVFEVSRFNGAYIAKALN